MDGKIICYNLKSSNLKRKDIDKFLRELVGHNDKSHGGRYTYRKKGLLDDIPNIKPIRSVIVVSNENFPEIENILKKYAINAYIRDILLKEGDLKILCKDE
ncbi:hypothetical protein BEH94_08465 [Candidatus Altiarchaeales archaeon WOR_SM1_SCG]|nr:hypothetical protein BEH94_08465 [Candidatus Altiarchaeales archaeon WOR_SM1_SCG]